MLLKFFKNKFIWIKRGLAPKWQYCVDLPLMKCFSAPEPPYWLFPRVGERMHNILISHTSQELNVMMRDSNCIGVVFLRFWLQTCFKLIVETSHSCGHNDTIQRLWSHYVFYSAFFIVIYLDLCFLKSRGLETWPAV